MESSLAARRSREAIFVQRSAQPADFGQRGGAEVAR